MIIYEEVKLVEALSKKFSAVCDTRMKFGRLFPQYVSFQNRPGDIEISD